MRKCSSIFILGLIAVRCSVVSAETDLGKIDTSKLPPAADKKGLTYTKDIRPLLEASCLRCHGQNRPKAGLQLDSLEGVLKGGEDGKVVVPGNGKKSLLVIAAAQIDEETAMPPKRRRGGRGPGGPGGSGGPGGGRGFGGSENGPGGEPGQRPPGGQGGPQGGGGGGGKFGPPPKPLTSDQVALLRAWVDQGAK